MNSILFFIVCSAACAFAQINGPYGHAVQPVSMIGQTAQDSSGWQDNGTWVGLRTSTDSVGLGARPLFGYYDIYANPGGTNNGITLLSLRRASTATPTTNFAAAINFYLESSTTEDQLSTRLISAWQTATHATRTSNLRINLVNSGTSGEYYRFTPTGLSIFGATTPTAKLEIYSRNNSTNAIYVNQDVSGADSSIVVLPNGNLGLATTSPSQKLHVVGNSLIDGLASSGTQSTTLAAAATALAVTKSFIILDGDAGGNTLATITGGISGCEITIKFIDSSVTITDDDTGTANTVNLSAAFTSTANDVVGLIFDGTSWFESSRSVN